MGVLGSWTDRPAGTQPLLGSGRQLPRGDGGPALPELLIFKDKLKILTFLQSILVSNCRFYFPKTNKTHLLLSLPAALPHMALLGVR